MTTLAAPPERAALYYRLGSSDKIYQCFIEPSGTGFVVTFAYGRRGSTLQTGSKTAEPVDYEEAHRIFDKLVAEKTAKGYSPGEDGTPYQGTTAETRATGILPQLLNPIDEAEAQQLLAAPEWWAQEKFDGQRVLLRKSGDTITGLNRQGLIIALPMPIVEAAHTFGGGQWLLDGEAMGERFAAFDLLEYACVDLRKQPLDQRLKALGKLGVPGVNGPIDLADTATTTHAKRALLTHLRKINAEGIVFKRRSAVYVPGRPASGGDQRKHKFTATASCVVAGHNGDRRSVALELLDGDLRVAVGSVTIPPNHPVPPAGAIVEVKYLYAYPGGSLFQPVYLGVRNDITLDACVLGQLKYKREGMGDIAG